MLSWRNHCFKSLFQAPGMGTDSWDLGVMGCGPLPKKKGCSAKTQKACHGELNSLTSASAEASSTFYRKGLLTCCRWPAPPAHSWAVADRGPSQLTWHTPCQLRALQVLCSARCLPSASADTPGTLVPRPDTPLIVTFRSALCSVTAAKGGPAQGC